MKRLFFILLFLSLHIGPLANTRALATKYRWDANKFDWTPLMIYSYSNNSLKIDSLIKLGVNINEQNPRGWTALDVAVRKGNTATVLLLLKNSADPNLSDSDGYTLLIWASGLDDAKIANLLLQYKAEPNKSFKNGYTALMFATSFGSIEIMRLLIENGANVNAKRSIDGMTALRLAEYNADKEKVNFLKQHGAK